MASGPQESSLIVRDLIQKSKLISEGPPARYCLLTTRSNLEKDGSVRKWTFGQRDNNMKNKIILMVGETGTGKSTLINAMVNSILGVKYEDEVWFEIIKREDNDKPNQSTTTEVTVYEVFSQDNPICLTLIDTPGFGDTRGTDQDKQIAENLYKLFDSDTGVKEIDAVCLVVKASDNRLSDIQQYIFDAVLSLFGKDIENNIFILITHSYGTPPGDVLNAIKKAGIPCMTDKENGLVHFLFNNQQTNKRINKLFQTAWEQTENTLDDFFSSLKVDNRKSLEKTETVITESKRLQICFSNLQKSNEFEEYKCKKLAQVQKALEENREEIKKNENFSFTASMYYKEKVPIENASLWDRKATTCSVCEENCHEYNCWCSKDAGWCYVMSNDHCTVCPGKCHYTKHVRENKKYIRRSREIIVTFDDLKKEYERSSNSKSLTKFDTEAFKNVKQLLENNKKQVAVMTSEESILKGELIKNKEKKSELVEEAYTIIMKLFEIALKPDSAYIIQTLDFLIPLAEETGKPDLAQTLRDMRKIKPESEERVHAVMKYGRAGFSKMKPYIPGNK